MTRLIKIPPSLPAFLSRPPRPMTGAASSDANGRVFTLPAPKRCLGVSSAAALLLVYLYAGSSLIKKSVSGAARHRRRRQAGAFHLLNEGALLPAESARGPQGRGARERSVGAPGNPPRLQGPNSHSGKLETQGSMEESGSIDFFGLFSVACEFAYNKQAAEGQCTSPIPFLFFSFDCQNSSESNI